MIEGLGTNVLQGANPFGRTASKMDFHKMLSSFGSQEKTKNTSLNEVHTNQTDLTLHWFDTPEGDIAISARGLVQDGSSMTVYKPADFDEKNPVYKVKVWDAKGNVTERMVDVSEIDPTACDAIEMYTYVSHLSASGAYPGALERFMMAGASSGESKDSYEDLFQETDWLKALKNAMQMQYNAGNLNGYMAYKDFLDYLSSNKN